MAKVGGRSTALKSGILREMVETLQQIGHRVGLRVGVMSMRKDNSSDSSCRSMFSSTFILPRQTHAQGKVSGSAIILLDSQPITAIHSTDVNSSIAYINVRISSPPHSPSNQGPPGAWD